MKIYRANFNHIDYSEPIVLFIDKGSLWELIDDTNPKNIILRPYKSDSIVGFRTRKEFLDDKRYFEEVDVCHLFLNTFRHKRKRGKL